MTMAASAAAVTAADKRGPLEPGVSQQLARWRAAHYRDLRYALRLELEPGATVLHGRLELRVRLEKSPVDLVLDWRGPAEAIRELKVNGRAAPGARIAREHLIVPARALEAGENLLSLDFETPVSTAGTAVLRYRDRTDGAEYLYTLLVPSDASSVFPCIDQPDLKAGFTLDIRAPANWRVIANAPLAERKGSGELASHRFAETEPISTYLFAFAAGPFEQIAEHAPGAAKPGSLRLFVRKSRLDRAREEAREVFDINRRAIDWYAAYFGHRFPFAKYDLVLLPEFAYGGMEHAGATFLREEAVLFPSLPSAVDRLRRAQLLLHELSHQWFGDLLTMRWFDDLWLKEGFANFMAAKAADALLREQFPDTGAWIAFHALKAAAYRTDATAGTTAIRQPLANLASAKSAYGNIVYSKGPAVLRQAEFLLGEAAFRRGVRALVKRRAYAAADWRDLVRALEAASGRNLRRWAEAWVRRPGMPRIRIERRTDREGRSRELVIRQHDLQNRGLHWPMKLRVLALGPDGADMQTVELRGKTTRVPLRRARQLDLVYANDGDFGYGQFLLDAASRDRVLAEPGIAADPLLRSLLLDALWEAVREAELDPAEYVRLALRVLPGESDDIAAAALLARIDTCMSRYLGPERRALLAAELEQFLAARMRSADPLGRRIGYFRSYAAVAMTAEGRAGLRALLDGTLTLPGLPLSARDRFRIVGRLLELEDPGAAQRLDRLARSDASDEARRYAYGIGAANADADSKQRYFGQFLGDAALPESWIEEALLPFNSPEHASTTRGFLGRALAALPELKRSRKIFFVNAWLAAFLGGQSDAAALAEVQEFLKRSRLDPDLRLKVLETMDALERTVKIRIRFG